MSIKLSNYDLSVLFYQKRINMKKFILPILFCFFANFNTANAQCGCDPISTIIEAKSASSFVMMVDVLEKTRIINPNIYDGYSEFILKVRVRRYWKGDAKRIMTIRVPENKDDCALNIELGESYLVYAVGKNVPLILSCSRTSLLSSDQAKADMIQLGENFKVPY